MDSEQKKMKQQLQDAVEENGRLAARIQATQITAQSEQDVMSIEVKFKHSDETSGPAYLNKFSSESFQNKLIKSISKSVIGKKRIQV